MKIMDTMINLNITTIMNTKRVLIILTTMNNSQLDLCTFALERGEGEGGVGGGSDERAFANGPFPIAYGGGHGR